MEREQRMSAILKPVFQVSGGKGRKLRRVVAYLLQAKGNRKAPRVYAGTPLPGQGYIEYLRLSAYQAAGPFQKLDHALGRFPSSGASAIQSNIKYIVFFWHANVARLKTSK